MITTKDNRQINRTTVYLEPELRKRLKLEALERDCSANDIVVAALEAWFEKEEDENDKA